MLARGSSSTGSTGSAEPVDFWSRVLEPVNFFRRKTERDRNSEIHVVACYPADFFMNLVTLIRIRVDSFTQTDKRVVLNKHVE